MKKSNLIYSYLLSAIFTENNLHGEEKEKEFLESLQYTLIGNKNGSTQIDKDLTPRSTIRYSSLAIIGNKKYIHSDQKC